jgi:hypothetical protein
VNHVELIDDLLDCDADIICQLILDHT